MVIADDAEATRALFRAQLDGHEGIEVVAEAANGVAALEAVSQHRPDVLLLDLAMPEMDGLQVLFALRADEHHDVCVVVLSGYARDRMATLVLEAGACAYLEKGVSAEVLTRTVLDACASTPGLTPKTNP